MFSELYLCSWIFLRMVQVEEALAEQGAELAEEGRTLREELNEAGGTLRKGLNEAGWSVKESRLSSGAWIGKLCWPALPGRSSEWLHTKLLDLCLRVIQRA